MVKLGTVGVGGDAPISVQSMTTTPTADIDATLQQIAELTAAGCDIVRVAVPSRDDARALSTIAAKSSIPVIADIHFNPHYALEAIEAGCAGVRVNLSAPPVEDVKVGQHILASLGLRPRKLEVVSCPGCGRCQVDIYTLAERVEAAFADFPSPLRVAVMGCIVNGPGEAREADLGVSSGNGKGQIFVRGEVVCTVAEHQIVEALLDEACLLADISEKAQT